MLTPEQYEIELKKINPSLSTIFHFIPLNNHSVFNIDQSVNLYLLNQIIVLVQKARYFSVQLESHQTLPNIIIELIHQRKSIILVVEINYYLLHAQQQDPLSLLSWLLCSLFKWIFHPKNVIYSWGNLLDALISVGATNLLPRNLLQEANIIDIEEEFKYWYCAKYENMAMDNGRRSLSQAISLTSHQVLSKSIIYNSCLAITKLAHLIGQDIGCRR